MVQMFYKPGAQMSTKSVGVNIGSVPLAAKTVCMLHQREENKIEERVVRFRARRYLIL